MLYSFEDCIGKTFPVYNKATYNTLLALTNPLNSYSIIIDEQLLELKDFHDIVSFIKKEFWGDCFPLTEHNKPITFIPICNLDSYKHQGLNSVTEITIAINSETNISDLFPIQKQIPYIYQSNSYKEIELELLKEFIIKLPSDVIINITGGNIFEYSKFKELYSFLSCYNNTKYFFRKEYINKNWNIKNSSMFFISPKTYDESICAKYDLPDMSFHFIIENEEELNLAISFKQKLKNANMTIQPFWNKNDGFFEKFVFFERNDLLLQNRSKSDIYINKNINKNFYGNLFIDPYGHIYTSYNLPSIGTYTSSIKQILKKAISPCQAWHLTRTSRTCTNCIYQWFCPPISDYELFLNKIKPCK